MLNSVDRKVMQAGVEEVILSFGKSMMVYRSQKAGEGSFAGGYQTSESLKGEYPIEQKLLSPKSLSEIGADLMIICGGETDISEGDRVVIDNNSYIASHISPQDAFGVVTHLEVNLEMDDSQP